MIGLQREVTLGMRAVLIDWLIEISDERRLQWESLHLGVQLLDTFLATRRVPRRSLQLLAMACLWIGAKYHELHPPSSRECARLVDAKCHWRDVVRMEQTVLEVVGFDMSAPTISDFLKTYMGGIAQDELVPSFAQYFCDLAIIHYSTTRFPPSYLAAAALLLAVGLGRMHAPEACVVPGLKLGQKELTAAVQELVSAYKWASYGNGRSSYVKQKYSHRRFHRVAKLPLSNASMPM
jgi:cyclin-A